MRRLSIMHVNSVNLFKMCVSFLVITILFHVAEIQCQSHVKLAGNRMYGGVNAQDGMAPYQVSLRKAEDNSKHFCGGSFISQCHILTAAHCEPGCRNLTCKVAYGSTELRRQILADVESITTHEDFLFKVLENGDIEFIKNDIAIIKIAPNSYPRFDGNTNKIELNREDINLRTVLMTTGWGVTDRQTTNPPEHLQVTKVITSSCTSEQQSWYSFICTAALLTGVCSGDSGGPLVYQGKLAGVTSFGSGCGWFISRNGFSDVNIYADWIEKQIKDTPC